MTYGTSSGAEGVGGADWAAAAAGASSESAAQAAARKGLTDHLMPDPFSLCIECALLYGHADAAVSPRNQRQLRIQATGAFRPSQKRYLSSRFGLSEIGLDSVGEV